MFSGTNRLQQTPPYADTILKGIPQHRHIYISALADQWATLSGPPSLFEELWSYSSTLASASKLPLPFWTPVHAPHLPPVDTESILEASNIHEIPVCKGATVLSATPSKLLDSSSLGGLIRQALFHMSSQVLDMAGLTGYLLAQLDHQLPIVFVGMGPPSQGDAFCRTLKDAGIHINHAAKPSGVPVTEPQGESDRIAVVGMSGRFPGSSDVEEFWKSLEAGTKFESKIPPSRFDLKSNYDPTGSVRNASITPYASFLDNPGVFDNRFFNISPREAKQMDPLQRLLLMCSYEALQMAGYNPDNMPTERKRVATYFGQGADDWREANASQDIDIYYVPGNCRSFGPGKLNYHYKWAGGNYAVDSACASSSTAIILACNSLIARECDAALAGGGSLFTAVEPFAGLSRAGFLSKTPGGCKTFRSDADGYGRGEGVGVIILKRLEDAVAANDNVLAVVAGGARNYSWNSTSITHPSADAQISVIKDVLRKARIQPHDIGYVEMHGTGTVAGDAVELDVMARIFGKRSKDNPLHLGAAKANVGHGESSSGITSMIKCIQMLRNNTIPPHPGFPGPRNPKLNDLDRINIRVSEKALPFRSRDGTTRILLNNFDASGGNNALLIEHGPGPAQKSSKDPRGYHCVVLSAKTTASLKGNIENLHQYVENHPGIQIADLAYTTTSRSMHEELRRAYTVQNVEDLRKVLASDAKRDFAATVSIHNPQVIFAFTGQGSQYAGMGEDLFASSQRFRTTVESLQELCTWHAFPSFIDLIKSGNTDMKSYSTVQVQLAILVLQMALVDLWRSWGLEPDLVIGYSLGEYAALHAAGVLSTHDVLYLVGHRAQLTEEKCTAGTHAMLVVQASLIDVEKLLHSHQSCEVSCMSAPTTTVVSGPSKDIAGLQTMLNADGLRTSLLEVPYGFHSQQLDPILDDFREIAERARFSRPRVPVASTLSGDVVASEGVFSPSYLVDQTRRPVNFTGALKACEAGNVIEKGALCIEISPRPVLSSLIGAGLTKHDTKTLHSLSDRDNNWKTLSLSASCAYTEGAPINWVKYHREYTPCLTLLELPAYAFDLKTYWMTNNRSARTRPTVTPPSAPPVPGFPTATLHRIQKEVLDGSRASVTFESSVFDPSMLSIIEGHVVNGVALCPASAFMDMAFSAAKYIHHRLRPTSPMSAMSLKNLSITHPLIPNTEQIDQMVIVKAEKLNDDWTIGVEFSSSAGKHGTCQVAFENESQWKADWARVAYFVNAAKEAVIRNARAGIGHHLQRSVVYKLFANLVHYSEAFQAMREVFVDPEFARDAVANLTLQPTSQHFTFNPYWSDALSHASGFLLNGNPSFSDNSLFISSGLEELRALPGLQAGKEYTSYAHLTGISEQGSAICDVYMFDEHTVVGEAKGIVFQKMSRRVLDVVLKRSGSRARDVVPEMKPAMQPAKRSRAEQNTWASTYRVETEGSTSGPAAGGEILEKTIDILLSMTGADPADIKPHTRLVEMGLDSLMTVEVISEIKTTLGIELPASFFNANATIADVRRALLDEDADQSEPMLSERRDSSEKGSPICTPDSEEDLQDSGPKLASMVIDIVLAQTGVDAASVTPSTQFTDLGLESLAVLEIIEIIKDKLDLELPANFFFQNGTPAQVRTALSEEDDDDDDEDGQKPGDIAFQPYKNGVTPKAKDYDLSIAKMKPLSAYHSNIVLLQGNARSKGIPLFLLPDGGGSATSFMHFPPLFPGNNPVFACESPFLGGPEEYQCSIEEVSGLYVSAIRKKQPRGPYLIGGYSLGAVYAFEVSKQLLDTGESILALFLIDFRISVTGDPTSRTIQPTMEIMDGSGLPDGVDNPETGFHLKPMSDSTKLHALASLGALVKYHPDPMKPGRQPLHTLVIWAGQGLESALGGIPPYMQGVIEEMQKQKDRPGAPPLVGAMVTWWFGEREAVEGGHGWDVVLGEEPQCVTVAECNHFSMVAPPAVSWATSDPTFKMYY
jgi:iterative type I PKS product template protein